MMVTSSNFHYSLQNNKIYHCTQTYVSTAILKHNFVYGFFFIFYMMSMSKSGPGTRSRHKESSDRSRHHHSRRHDRHRSSRTSEGHRRAHKRLREDDRSESRQDAAIQGDVADDDEEGEWVEATTTTTSQTPEVDDLSSSDSEIIGPSLPKSIKFNKGPTLPDVTDVQAQNVDMFLKSLEDARNSRVAAIRQEEAGLIGAADNLLPGGSNLPSDPREKKMEKRMKENEDRKEYIRARSPGGMDEIDDNDLYGGSSTGGNISSSGIAGKLKEIAARRDEKARIKQERRDALHREREAERRLRWQAMEEREARTIEAFKEIVKERFG
ncbi:hypothetical protein V1514DRAFT_327076 [Lipomyces japonicus]|uniref:uncharacterized protein n=1 Tax=Lipomyces japonicus TaxID=56871 RepID=UPI0034CE20B8